MESPEQRIRRYLEDNGGTIEVTAGQVLESWEGSADAAQIEQALARIGIEYEPSLQGLGHGTGVRLRLAPLAPAPWDAPAPAQQPPPPWNPSPAADQTRAAGPVVGGSSQPSIEIVGLALVPVAALALLIASFLPWVSAPGRSFTSWKLFNASDILLALAVVVAIGAAGAAAFGPLSVRRVAIACAGALAGLGSVVPLEIMSQSGDGASSVQAGEILSVLASVVLLAAAILLGVNSRPIVGASRVMIARVGAAALVAAGVLAPLVFILPLAGPLTFWRAFTVGDILVALLGVAVAAAGVALIAFPREPRLVAVPILLGSMLAASVATLVIEVLASGEQGAGVWVSLLFVVPLAVGGVALIVVGGRSVPPER